ncbi:sugar ABC transporter permease [Gracilibacillus boraciitolerans JCM 21714]|uniref:Sugar ABC transporter permease n=1 Tax=Gracilibacillus boraciitolerans JCM 21714 TaxID=1298598 RepID=W4VPQ8_9BACI|nr:sugar ABC transporter permease [Gracilibacillus boraciitolerans]GAE94734.1 sugar ABC transporter permease [Gracilibacillus boraciitolerans JCM 21714]
MKKNAWVNELRAIPFLLPFFIAYFIFTIFPIFKGLEMSLFDWTLIRKLDFVGMENYQKMFTDKQFWQTLKNTTLFVILTTPSMVLLALYLALLANLKTRFQRFFRSAFFLPSILSVAVISFIAVFMLQPYNGFVNTIIQSFGVDAEPFWLRDNILAWVTIIVVTLWWTVGFNMILFLASLQDIPDSLYEASEIDGGFTLGSVSFYYITTTDTNWSSDYFAADISII